jgi:LURP-one-related
MYRGNSTDEKDLICTIKTCKVQSRPEYHVFLVGNASSEQQCDLKVKEGYNSQQMNFYLGDTDKVVAQILLFQDSYGLTIYANMDYAFVVAMTSILDAIRDDSVGQKTSTVMFEGETSGIFEGAISGIFEGATSDILS